MITPLLVGALLLIVSVVFSAMACSLIVRIMIAMLQRGYAGDYFLGNVMLMVITVLIATADHLFLIGVWAIALMLCGEFTDFNRAYYHSAGNYTTLGYGDIVMSDRWKLLGPLEAINGVLLIGLFTALLFAVLNRLVEQRLKLREGS